MQNHFIDSPVGRAVMRRSFQMQNHFIDSPVGRAVMRFFCGVMRSISQAAQIGHSVVNGPPSLRLRGSNDAEMDPANLLHALV